MKKITLLLVLIAFFAINSKASHSVGGEITYQWVSGNTYDVQLTLYSECLGPTSNSKNLNYSSISCGINQFVSLNLFSSKDVSQVCDTNLLSCNGGSLPGLKEDVYKGLVTGITPCTDWVLSYNECCLGVNFQNIATPTSNDLYIEARLNNTTYLNNQSPIFIDSPRWILSVNQNNFINVGAYDLDGDSLYFSMVTPLVDALTTMNFNAGYSATEPFVSSPATTFNNATGVITSTPTTIMTSYISVKVEEYRSGQLIGSITRDFTSKSLNNPIIGCDSVWPGDANSDLVANVYDILPIGVFYDSTGTIRPSATTNWVAQYSSNWGLTQFSGADFKHIDCNGDSLIDSNDVSSILLNYNLTHVARWGENNTEGINDPNLYVDIALDTILTSTALSIPIKLGTASLPADSVYGFAMSITYNPETIDSIAGISVDYSNSWLGTKGVDMITIDTNFYSNGQIDIGVVRTDGQMMSGFGEIFTLNVITIDNLSGKGLTYKKLPVDFVNVVIIDNKENQRAFNQEMDSIVIKSLQTGINDLQSNNKVKIIPNPNNGSFKLLVENVKNPTIRIYNMMGQDLDFQSSNQDDIININMEAFEKGIYFIRIIDRNNILTVEKVIIN